MLTKVIQHPFTPGLGANRSFPLKIDTRGLTRQKAEEPRDSRRLYYVAPQTSRQ